MKRRRMWVLLTAAAVAALGGMSLAAQPGDPVFDPGNFVEGADHPFFPLAPGTTFHYAGQTDEGTETIEVTVTKRTKQIMGVSAIVVRDQVFLDGELIEDTEDWSAQDRQGNVWYLGEDSRQYEDGRLVGTEGSWEAGRDGARAGIIMLANPQVGDSYAQESLPGVAEDMAKVMGLKSIATVPLGTYGDCLETMEWTPLEPGAREHKFYARGVGLVLEVSSSGGGERVELTDISQG